MLANLTPFITPSSMQPGMIDLIRDSVFYSPSKSTKMNHNYKFGTQVPIFTKYLCTDIWSIGISRVKFFPKYNDLQTCSHLPPDQLHRWFYASIHYFPCIYIEPLFFQTSSDTSSISNYLLTLIKVTHHFFSVIMS